MAFLCFLMDYSHVNETVSVSHGGFVLAGE